MVVNNVELAKKLRDFENIDVYMAGGKMWRNRILDRYTSLRQFALEADIPYSSLMTILSRGIGGASFDMVMRICRCLNIDPSELAEPHSEAQ